MAPNTRSRRLGKAPRPDWSNLPTDLLIYILQRPLISFEDFIAFKRVCSSWRSAAAKERENFNTSRQHVPWLVLVALDHGFHSMLYSPSRQKYYQLAQPPFEYIKRCPTRIATVNSCLGWIVIASGHLDDISLFNPFSGTRIQLPTRVNTRKLASRPKKFALSANPSWTSDYTVMMITDRGFHAFWKPGQSSWTRIKGVGKLGNVVGITYHKGRFYTVDTKRVFMAFTIKHDDAKATSIAEVESVVQIASTAALPTRLPLYIMESAESLLVVASNNNHRGLFSFEIYDVNVSERTVSVLESVGDRALYLGENSSCFSVKASECSGCEAGTITVSSRVPHQPSNCWVTVKKRSCVDKTLFQEKAEAHRYHSPLWIQPTF